MTTTDEASLPLTSRRRTIDIVGRGAGNDDDPPRSTPPPPSPPPSPPHHCCDESPRPGELEAIRSAVMKKRPEAAKAKASFSPSRTRGSGGGDGDGKSAKRKQPSDPAPPSMPIQKKRKKEKKCEDGKKRETASSIPLDARPALAAERERHRFDPRSTAPGWHPPPSPLSLIEEALYRDPWKLLVACCLLNRTTAGVARPCVKEFFRRYPDAAAAAAIGGGEGEEEGEAGGGGSAASETTASLAKLFRPCGCHRKRAVAVVRMSREFLRASWRDPRELFGVGEYAADAYWIFVRGIWHCGAEGEAGEGGGGEEGEGGGGGEKTKKARSRSAPPSSSSPKLPFSWRPKDKDLARYVDFLVETEGQGSGLEREEF